MSDQKLDGVTLKKLAPNWIDFETASESCHQPLRDLGVPEKLIGYALTPGAMPRVEVEGDTTLVLLRIFDDSADQQAASTRELTRKLGVFIRGEEVITVHRFPTPNIPKLFESGDESERILSRILERMLITYTKAIEKSDDAFDAIEESVFQESTEKPFHLKDGYYFKRRLNAIRKVLNMTEEALDLLVTLPGWEKHANLYRVNTRKRLRHAITNAESLLYAVNQLLELQLAIVSQKTNEASQRTNEVMRVLTVFSAYFLPLSFIAGLYGMNFLNMPELRWHNGYYYVLVLMASIVIGITVWFRNRGWMGAFDIPKED